MELVKYYNITLDRIHLDMNELYILMGYGTHIPPQYILEMIEEMFLYLQTSCKPKCGYMICKGNVIDKYHIEIDGVRLNTGGIITHAMKGAHYFAVFTATIGKEFDEWLKQISESDNIVEAFVANTLGSILAEGVVSQLTNQLEKNMLQEGLLVSNNYSPGYCDWGLIEQRKLFSILPTESIGIQLTESCLMLPIKSVSGIVAIGKDVKKQAYRCDICNMKNCVRNMKKKTIEC